MRGVGITGFKSGLLLLQGYHGWMRKAAGFGRSQDGMSSIMFGLTAFATFTFVGAAVDTARFVNARSNTIDAIDAAVLAGGRALQTGSTDDIAKFAAMQLYVNNTRSRPPVVSDTVNFEIRNGRTTVAAVGQVYIRTPFLGLAHVEKLPLYVANEGTGGAEARITQNTAASYNREVVLMLDVSGSMCSPCTKRDDMKAAAKDLVEIMMKNNATSAYWSKIALVPFSGDVRPGDTLFAAAADPAAPKDRSFTFTTGGKKPKTSTVVYTKTACLAERSGDNRYTDAGPSAGNYLMPVYANGGNCAISSAATITPMSLDKASVLAKIDGLTTGGGTAGHLGTAWSYYMLSPKWNASLPLAAQASPFNASGIKKIAVLMTDGEYNQEYDANGIDTSDQVAGASVNGATSAQQAVSICAEMKKNGIDVYTVGFDLPNQAAKDTLANCASDVTKNYTVATGEQLRAAFRDIAVRTTQLHLAK